MILVRSREIRFRIVCRNHPHGSWVARVRLRAYGEVDAKPAFKVDLGSGQPPYFSRVIGNLVFARFRAEMAQAA